MEKNRKILAILLLTALLSASAGGLLVAMPVVNDSGKLPTGYKSFSGVITEVTKSGDTIIMIEKADESTVGFLVTDDTYVFEGVSLVPGQKIKAFYDVALPAPAIFPPRYIAAVIAGVSASGNVFVGCFDENLLSSDNELKLNIGANTVIVDRSGKSYDGDPGGRRLAVVYAVVTMSIPAQTSPSKVVVLDATDAADKIPVKEDKPAQAEVPAIVPLPDVFGMPIVVNGNTLTAPSAYRNDDGLVMVPVRAIAEALGFKVTWDDATRMVIINNIITFQPGKDYYTYARMAPFTLGAAPELKDGRTFVPLKLFTEVANFKFADIVEDQIVINN